MKADGYDADSDDDEERSGIAHIDSCLSMDIPVRFSWGSSDIAYENTHASSIALRR